jgi:hypothetical protein
VARSPKKWRLAMSTEALRKSVLLVKAFLVACGSMLICAYVADQGTAAPILQLYVEGAHYNDASESWEISGFSDGSSFRLWAIGNVSGPGGAGTIHDVRLAVAYLAESDASTPLVLDITPTRIGGDGNYNGIVDSVVASDPVFLQRVTNGSTPILGTGKALPSHGVYGTGVYWQEFLLGDFNQTGDSVADFIDAFPELGEVTQGGGQINAYDVRLLSSSTHPTFLHFDLYNHVESKNHVKSKFSPFSHDVDADVHVAPEPTSVVAWSLALAMGICLSGTRFLRRGASRLLS